MEAPDSLPSDPAVGSDAEAASEAPDINGPFVGKTQMSSKPDTGAYAVGEILDQCVGINADGSQCARGNITTTKAWQKKSQKEGKTDVEKDEEQLCSWCITRQRKQSLNVDNSVTRDLESNTSPAAVEDHDTGSDTPVGTTPKERSTRSRSAKSLPAFVPLDKSISSATAKDDRRAEKLAVSGARRAKQQAVDDDDVILVEMQKQNEADSSDTGITSGESEGEVHISKPKSSRLAKQTKRTRYLYTMPVPGAYGDENEAPNINQSELFSTTPKISKRSMYPSPSQLFESIETLDQVKALCERQETALPEYTSTITKSITQLQKDVHGSQHTSKVSQEELTKIVGHMRSIHLAISQQQDTDVRGEVKRLGRQIHDMETALEQQRIALLKVNQMMAEEIRQLRLDVKDQSRPEPQVPDQRRSLKSAIDAQYDLIKKTRNRFATSPNDDDDEYIGDRP